MPSDALAPVCQPTYVARGEAVCPFCEGRFTRNDPPMHYAKRRTEGRLTTESYQGTAHRVCIAQADLATRLAVDPAFQARARAIAEGTAPSNPRTVAEYRASRGQGDHAAD